MRTTIQLRFVIARISFVANCALAALCLGAAARAQQQPAEPASPDARAEPARAVQRCEAAVVETLRKLRGAAVQDVQFLPAERSVAQAEDSDIAVRGGGRYRPRTGTASSSFSYSCSFSPKTDLASGVVLRDAASAAAPAAWQPDLSRVSPESCESAIAQLLKNKHPRVAQIGFEPDTRRMEPGPDNHIVLQGHGGVQRAPGMNSVPFSYRCEIDPRNGRVVDVKTSV